jgi:hypothetical protein
MDELLLAPQQLLVVLKQSHPESGSGRKRYHVERHCVVSSGGQLIDRLVEHSVEHWRHERASEGSVVWRVVV